MGLIQENLTEAVARADGSIKFWADAGEENGPYDPTTFRLQRGPWVTRGVSMSVDGRVITVRFEAPLHLGDVVLKPE